MFISKSLCYACVHGKKAIVATAKIQSQPFVPPTKHRGKQKRATRAANSRQQTELAPDGLPWPKGYFDRPARETVEEATAKYGVRPSEYYKGWPCYTAEETERPEFKSQLPEEPIEVQEQWRKEWADWEAGKRNGRDNSGK